MAGIFQRVSKSIGEAVGAFEVSRFKARVAAMKPAEREAFIGAWAESMRWTGGNYYGDEEAAQKRALTNAWYFSGVVDIAGEVASARMHVVERTDVDADPIDVPNHEFEQRLRRPNPWMGRAYLWMYTAMWLKLDGNAYWYLGLDDSGRLAELWPLPSNQTVAWPGNSKEFVESYIYTVYGREYIIQPNQVCHIQNIPNPFNPFDGLSELAAALLPVDGDLAMARYNAKFFDKDNVMPSAIINLKASAGQTISPADVTAFKAELKEAYAAGKRKTYITGAGGGIDVELLGWNNRDMEFSTGRDKSRREILEILGIPEGLRAMNTTEASANVAERQFKNTVYARSLIPISEQVTSQIVIPYYGEQYEAIFNDIRPANREIEMQEADRAQGALTVDEVRKRFFKLDPIGDERGVELYQSRGVKTLQDVVDAIPPTEPKKALADLEYDRDPQAEDGDLGKERKAEIARQTGVMVAFFLPTSGQAELWAAASGVNLPDGAERLPPQELHVTLGFLGDVSELQPVDKATIKTVLSEFANEWAPVEGVVNGTGRFENDPMGAWYASFDAPALSELRHELVEALEKAGLPIKKEHGFSPHITLAYLPAEADTPRERLPRIPATIAGITLAWAGEHYSYDLSGSRKALDLAAIEDLKRWKAKAIRYARKGRQIEFESSVIPEDLQSWIDHQLNKAATIDEIKSVFDFGTSYNPSTFMFSEPARLPELPDAIAFGSSDYSETMQTWNAIHEYAGLLDANIVRRIDYDLYAIGIYEPSDWEYNASERIYSGKPGTLFEGRSLDLEGQIELRDLWIDYQAGRLPLDLDGARQRVKETFIGVYALSAGGFRNMDRMDWERLADLVLAQYRLLQAVFENFTAGKLDESAAMERARAILGNAVQAF